MTYQPFLYSVFFRRLCPCYACAWVCVTDVVHLCVEFFLLGLCDQFTFYSRVFMTCITFWYSVWRFDLRLFDESWYSVWRFDLRLCAEFVLSGLCDQFTFHSCVFTTCISLGTLCGVLIFVCDECFECVCVSNFDFRLYVCVVSV